MRKEREQRRGGWQAGRLSRPYLTKLVRERKRAEKWKRDGVGTPDGTRAAVFPNIFRKCLVSKASLGTTRFGKSNDADGIRDSFHGRPFGWDTLGHICLDARRKLVIAEFTELKASWTQHTQ